MTPAIDERSAARILDLSQPPRGSRSRAIACFAVILALAAHAALNGGFPLPAHGAAMSPAGASPQARESAHMKRLMAIGAAAAVSAGASAQDAVQWRVEDGGNGHWYFYQAQLMTWTSARASAQAVGGDLASLESAAEWSWARSRFSFSFALVGARQDQGAKGTAIGWRWLSGDAVTQFTLVMDDNPCGASDPDVEDGQQDFGEMVNDVLGDINAVSSSSCADAGARPSLVEWSADCNNDGIVDYGQIRAGELADANANNIPDCCENGPPCGCAGDTNDDRSVDGIDLATILTHWAQPAAAFPDADCNRDGVIDGNDLAIVLGSWGACP
jgi:hypothetical protein